MGLSKEEIAKKYVPCRCDQAYISRGLAAPDCPYHSTDPESAMEEWAKQQAIDFALKYAKSIHDDTYIKPTEAELEIMSFRYDKFIKVQSQNK